MIYDPYKDTPNKIASEGQLISITFEKTSASSAHICWTLPYNLGVSNTDQIEYNGIVIVLDTVPILMPQTPVNGKYYVADYTADRDLHIGDKIGTGLVIGAFYDDKTTHSIDIQGIEPSTSYYVAGFAVNNVAQYHTAGVHSYSLELKLNKTGNDTAGYDIVKLGVHGTDSTRLTPSTIYPLIATIDNTLYTWNFLGSDIPTYQDLVDVVNYKISTIDNPYIGAIPQNANGLYVDLTNKKLYRWDGYQNNILPAYFGDPSPDTVNIGSYWDNGAHLSQWNGSAWLPVPSFNYTKSPDQLECQDYWFDGSIAHNWNTNVWIPYPTYISDTDPTLPPGMACNTYWFNTNTDTLYYWQALTDCDATKSGRWVKTTAILYPTDPTVLTVGAYWFNLASHELKIRTTNTWSIPLVPVYLQASQPIVALPGSLWYNEAAEELKIFNTTWSSIDSIAWPTDPMVTVPGELWWNTTADTLNTWDAITNSWVVVQHFNAQNQDPSLASPMVTGSMWYSNAAHILNRWDGTQWNVVPYFTSNTAPSLSSGDYWKNTATGDYYQYVGGAWVSFPTIKLTVDPLIPAVGDFWYSPINSTLYTWTGLAWMPVMFSTSTLAPSVDTLWYNTITKTLSRWNGTNWVPGVLRAVANLDTNGDFVLTSTSKGSGSTAWIAPYANTQGTIPGLFTHTIPQGQILPPIKGTDAISEVPMYNQVGVGTDGSEDERKNLAHQILMFMGYPSVKVELSKDQLNLAIDQALSMYRRNSGSAYERAIFFMDFMPGQQGYYLTDKTAGLHRIVRIQSIHRKSSAFLGTATGQGVYGQMVLQHLYQMGTYDLVSYHIISEYVELMEILFATRVVFRFHERSRRLDIFQNIGQVERVLVDCTLERTEQELMTDRISSKWIKDWALGEACQMVAQTRGKFSSLPGAAGGISLNASDLQARADALFAACLADIDDYVASEPENTGLESTIVIG